MSASELVDALKGYTYTYDFAGKVSENQGNVITELYVTITAATSTNTPSTPIASSDYKAVVTPVIDARLNVQLKDGLIRLHRFQNNVIIVGERIA